MNEKYGDIMTLDEVAELLKISRCTVLQKIVKTNTIPYRRIGSLYRFRTEDVIKYTKGNQKEE